MIRLFKKTLSIFVNLIIKNSSKEFELRKKGEKRKAGVREKAMLCMKNLNEIVIIFEEK